MTKSTVTAMSDHVQRARRVDRAVAARRRLDAADERRRRARGGGRVWVNGRELGGPDPRFAHLSLSFD